MDLYEELGLRPMINAGGTYTAVGGSRMAPETLAAMAEAAARFVNLEELQEAVNQRVAELTRNEAAYLCNSCSTALYLATAACVTRRYGTPFHLLGREQIADCQVVALWSQHIPYDYAIAQTGVTLRFVGYPNPEAAFSRQALRQQLGDKTVLLYFAARTPRGYYGPECMNLEDMLQVAGELGIPVLVDAAAQLPPKSNLWEFTQMGATFAAFSGGKDLRGPQASGLLVGKREYLELVRQLGFPKYSVGRLMKIGREELAGLYTAIRAYVAVDEDARLRWCEGEVAKVVEALRDSPVYTASRCWPNQAGQPLPRAFVGIREGVPLTAGALRQRLAEGKPAVWCLSENRNGIYVNPMCLYEGETEAILRRLAEIGAAL